MIGFGARSTLRDMTQQHCEPACDPDDIMAALDRLRDAVFRAVDEAGVQGNVSPETGRKVLLLGADVYVISKRQRPHAPRDRIYGGATDRL